MRKNEDFMPRQNYPTLRDGRLSDGALRLPSSGPKTQLVGVAVPNSN